MNWIKCSDSLPGFYQVVLAFNAGGDWTRDEYPHVAYRREREPVEGHTWLWELATEDDWHTQDFFTHWAPIELPESP